LRENQKVKDRFLAYIPTIIGSTQSPILSREELDYLPKNSPKHAILAQHDAAILFPERLMEKVVNPPRGWFKKIEGALEAFFQTVDAELSSNKVHRSIRPSPYYAILCADGDRMGETIDHLAGQANGLARHQGLSRALTGFSKGVRKIVENYHGVPIYSGGDDIVALLPVNTALACAQELAQAFREQLGSFKFKEDENPTLSVGLAIVHHLSLLQDCLDIARKAEKKAKDVDKKNALAIIIQKRSGEEYALAGSWGNPKQGTLGQAEYLAELIGYFQNDQLPRGAAYELREVAQRLTSIEKSSEESREDHALPPILWLEAKRILRRKLKLPQSRLARQSQQGEDWLKQGEVILDRLLARIEAPAEPVKNESDAANQKKQPERVSLQKYIDELIIAQELAKLMQLSPREAQ
jgi:CRISPR-associated protein Cmr2